MESWSQLFFLEGMDKTSFRHLGKALSNLLDLYSEPIVLSVEVYRVFPTYLEKVDCFKYMQYD